MMHKEAEMSVEELKAMYAKMAEDSANVESEEKVNSPTAPMIFALSTTTLLAQIMMIQYGGKFSKAARSYLTKNSWLLIEPCFYGD